MVEKLQQDKLLNVITSVQVAAIDNQPAHVQFGERKPRITGVTSAGRAFGSRAGENQPSARVNNTELVQVGTMFNVTGTVRADTIWAELTFDKSYLGEEKDGVPIVESADQVIRSPSIHNLSIKTTLRMQNNKTAQLSCYSSAGDRMLALINAEVVGSKDKATSEVEKK
jgi:hypothetical protein